MTTFDQSEREAVIEATVANYIAGEITQMRASSTLVLCGLNAKEIEELLLPHRTEAFNNFRNKTRGPIK